jgi:hypothetical protein
MALATRNSGNGNQTSVARYRDPFTMARELLSWDPFFGGRPATAFSPAFEVKETTDSFVLKADVPGVNDSDLDLAVHNNILTVSGSRQADERKEAGLYASAPVRLVLHQLRTAGWRMVTASRPSKQASGADDQQRNGARPERSANGAISSPACAYASKRDSTFSGAARDAAPGHLRAERVATYSATTRI